MQSLGAVAEQQEGSEPASVEDLEGEIRKVRLASVQPPGSHAAASKGKMAERGGAYDDSGNGSNDTSSSLPDDHPTIALHHQSESAADIKRRLFNDAFAPPPSRTMPAASSSSPPKLTPLRRISASGHTTPSGIYGASPPKPPTFTPRRPQTRASAATILLSNAESSELQTKRFLQDQEIKRQREVMRGLELMTGLGHRLGDWVVVESPAPGVVDQDNQRIQDEQVDSDIEISTPRQQIHLQDGFQDDEDEGDEDEEEEDGRQRHEEQEEQRRQEEGLINDTGGEGEGDWASFLDAMEGT